MTTPPPLGSRSGVSRSKLRSRAFARVTRDVYVLAEHASSFGVRCDGVLLALPDAVLSHATAAVAQGLPVPHDDRLHVTRPAGCPASERAGVVTHRRVVRPDEVLVSAGRPTTTPVRTFLDVAPVLPLVDLVVLGDAVAARAGLPGLQAAVREAAGRPGVRGAREALRLVDPGSDSPAESRARLVLHGAGFRGLRHQVQVLDEHGGWVSRPDLADEDARVAVQYDGLVHLEAGPRRWRADIDRDEQTRAAGWEVVVLTARDLRQPALAVGKVAAAYARAAGRRAR